MQPGVCERLDIEARRLAGMTDAVPPDGEFSIRFVGRLGIRTHKPQHVGDGEQSVLIAHAKGGSAQSVA